MFKPGDHVRHNTANIGTGQVVRTAAFQELRPDGKVVSYLRYDVRWLDQNGQVSREVPEALSPSVRNVPEFASVEEADAWMESQMAGGGWTAAAEDSNATVATILDRTAAEVAAEAEASLDNRCGGKNCECQDCVCYEDPQTLLREHAASFGCSCSERGCPCLPGG